MDVIAAVSTAPGRGAIGILRLSGDGAVEVVSRVFRPKGGRLSTGRLVYGELLDAEGRVIDLCLCTVARAPRSYTGEDTAEIQCHGSPVVLSEGLRALFHAGARQAKAGEFTKRAFLNGKMDLTGAEAVIDLIDAETPLAARNAAGQLGGAILTRAEKIYDELVGISAHFAATIDFPDDDIDKFELRSFEAALRNAESALAGLAGTYERGRFLKDGVPTAIIGRPNAGKSSLLNALLGFERAIVTASAGTTRDTVEEKCVLGGVPLRLIDTAGLRDASDEAERLGVERSERAAKDARLILGVFDGSGDFGEEDARTLELMASAPLAAAIINKSDLERKMEIEWNGPTFSVSARTGEGLEALSDFIKANFSPEDVPDGGLITGARQAEELRRAALSVREAREAMENGLTPDAVLTSVEEAEDAIASLLGRSAREDVIENIFHRFCVGK